MPLRLLRKLGEALRDKIAPADDAQSKPPAPGRPARPADRPRTHNPDRGADRGAERGAERRRGPRGPRRPESDGRDRPPVPPREAAPHGDQGRRQPPHRQDRPEGGNQGANRPPRGEGRGQRREPSSARPERPRREPRPSPDSRPPLVPHSPGEAGAPAPAPAGPPAAPAASWSLDAFQVPPAEGRTRFHDFDLPAEIMHAIADLGFQYCTPIQAASLKQALAGANVAGRAQTGTGKTAAFLVAILSRYLRSPAGRADKPGTPRALVIAPTRELCVQICNDAQALGKYCGLRSLAVFGGMDYVRQQRQLAEGPVDLLAATPGRLLDFQRQHVIDLGRVDTLVIDEADRMLDMGFIPDVRRIIRCLPDRDRRQTLLYSATLDDEVMRLAAQWMPDPVKIEIEPEHVASDTIEQKVFIVTSAQKFTLLCNLLKDYRDARVLIFGNRRMSTDRLAIRLRRQGFSCELLSGDVQQTRRMRVLEDFRSGAVKIVVATDVAGRGLHITDIGLVVNFELPYEAEDYVHRIGRTGRAGKVGTAVSFACEDESFQIPEIEKFLGETLKCTLPDDALLAPLPPPAPLPPRREGERGAAGAYGRPDGRHGGQGGDRPRGGRDGDRGEPRHSAQPPRHEAPRHSEPPRNEPPPQGGAAPVEAVTPSPAPQPSPPEPRATEPRATEPRATEPRAMEPRPAPPPRPAAHHRPPAETPVAHARAIPPPSAATHPGHARVQVWEPGGNKA